MELLRSLLSEQMIERLGWMLVHFLWQGVAAAALLWCLMKVLGKASSNTRYIAACAGLVLMVAAPMATFVMTAPDGPVAAVQTPVEQPVVISPVPAPAKTITIALAEPVALPAPSFWDVFLSRLEAVLPYCVAGWFVGVAVLSIWYLGGWCQLQKLRRIGTKAVSDCVEANASLLAQRLGIRRAIQIAESALVQVPTVIGWLKPVILLPAAALTGLDEIQLKAMIAHELAHIKRCDYLVNIAQTVVEILGFYHPAVWWVSRQIRIERENCCDDMAVALLQNRKDYAGALFTMEAIRTHQRDLAVAANGGHLTHRISRLAEKPVSNSQNGWVPVAVTFGLLIILLSGIAFTSQTSDFSGERVWHFPADESLGGIFVQVDHPENYLHDFNPFHDLAQWQTYSNAKGDVKVPAGKRVKLSVRADIAEHPEKLAALEQMKPDDLYLLQLASTWSSPKPATDTCIPYIRHLTGLKHLDIGDSAITQKGLEQLSEMKELERIVLPKNLKNGGLGTVAKMTSLQSVRFRENRISDKAIALLARLPHLKELCLYGCENLTDEGLSHLPKLIHLEHLTVCSGKQPFSPKGYSYIAQIPNLRSLWIDTGDCTDEKLQPFRQHPTLEKLSLHWESNITDQGVDPISTIRNLKLLDVSSARKLSDQSLELIGKMTRLEHLNLPSIATDSGVEKLASLKNLRFLNVNPTSNSPLTDQSLKVISRLAQLEELWTGGAGFSDEGMQQLTSLKNLKKLVISTAPNVTDTGFGYLSLLETLEELTWGMGESKITFAGVNKFENHKRLKKLKLMGITKGESVLDLSGMENLQQVEIEMPRKYDKENRTSTFTDSFSDDDLACLAELKKLDYLQLSGNGMGDRGLAYVSGLDRLQTLFLYGNTNITDAGLKHLSGLDRLWQLHIHDGHFSDNALKTLAQLQGLEILELTSDTAFSEAAKAEFKAIKKDMKKLKLDVDGNKPRTDQTGSMMGGGMSEMGGDVLRAAEKAAEAASRLEVINVELEPVAQGKNVLYATIKNTSNIEPLLGIHIYTRSPDYGPEGIGWGTAFFEKLRAGETKRLRFTYKIQGPVTDKTYVHVKFYNPITEKDYDYDKPFATRRFESKDLIQQELSGEPRPASDKQLNELSKSLQVIQNLIANKEYEKAWDLFSADYRNTEYQRKGFEAFKKQMEPSHPMDSAFLWEKGDFLKLRSVRAYDRKGRLQLEAACDDNTWIVDFVKEDDVWKINWIAGYTPADPNQMRTEIYDVGDLIFRPSSFESYPKDADLPKKRIKELTQTIIQSIVPESWQENSGEGRIDVHADTKLVIYQAPQVHETLKQYFNNLRQELFKYQIAIDVRFLMVPDSFLNDFEMDIQGQKVKLELPLSHRITGQVVEGPANSEEIMAVLELRPLTERILLFDNFQTLDDLQIDFLLKAVQQQRNAKQLSAPKAMVLNHEVASMQIQEAIKYMDVDNSEREINKGITLDIQPHVQNDGREVLLKGHIQVSDILENKLLQHDGAVYHIPYLQVVTIPVHTLVPSRGTILVLGPELKTEQKEADKPTPPKQRLLVLIKPTIVEQEEAPTEAIGALAPEAGSGYGGGMGGIRFGGGRGAEFQPPEK